MHRIALLITILLSTISALQLPGLEPFLAALAPVLDGDNSTSHHDLIKRQSNGCLSGYNNCASIGAAGVCCVNTAVCSADAAGHVACCKSGSVCTGTIGPIITAGTVDGSGNLVGGTTQTNAGGTTTQTTAVVASTTTASYATAASTTTTATTNTGGGFIIASNSVVANPSFATRGVQMPLLIRIVTTALAFILRI